MTKRHPERIALLSFVLATLVGISASAPVALRADDTEIYLGDDSLAEATRSNVLFILERIIASSSIPPTWCAW